VKCKVPVAIAIAGSDSGGGAGIQADLKTFAALRVHGTTAITSVTAQNTKEVASVEDLEPKMIRDQIRVVAEDFGIDAGKTGMLHTEEIIKAVSCEVSKYGFPLVVDPVMISKTGSPLLKPEAMDALKKFILPIAAVVTPNRFEAEKLANVEIRTLQDAETAAKRISTLGPKAVVIKGGHLETQDAIDLLYWRSSFKQFKSPRLAVKTTHGTGCSFSAAIAAELAKKTEIEAAVKKAKEIVALGIKFGLAIGKGYGPVNPMASLYRDSARFAVLTDLEEARFIIERHQEIVSLIPEVGMNIAMAVPYAESVGDVAAIEGRIVKTGEGPKAVGKAKFGTSSHLAKYILEITNHDERKKAAINVRFDEKTLRILKNYRMTVSFYDRTKEPEEIKKVEGMTIPWGVREAIKRTRKIPDALYHRGDIGKEPMIVVFGERASELAKLAVRITARGEKS
jgi:hydroxymethylpyrimidine kinase/phosphomethylpyrimidine kinase